jgi:hypothetical protein
VKGPSNQHQKKRERTTTAAEAMGIMDTAYQSLLKREKAV